MAEKLGMDALQVASHARTLSGYSASLEGIAGEVARAGFASQNPTLFGLVPGVNLVMTAGSILLAQSAAADVRAALASASELTGRLFGDIEAQIFASSADDGSYILGFISAADAQALYDDILKNPDHLTDLTPSQVAAFWKYLSVEQSDKLWQTYPRIVGNLSGVPADVRVNANHLSAVNDLESENYRSEEQKNYLELVRDGKYQLYTYDPDNNRLVEVIGLVEWNETDEKYNYVENKPTESITYVPGTMTQDDNFYNGDIRQIPDWIHSQYPDAVVFIYKDGVFPGGNDGDDLLDGIPAAKDPVLAAHAGETLAQFREDIGRETILAGADQTAIGHSWGLANIANSEVSGAHYDNVISLAGAWVPEAWAPDPTTDYNHHSYTDWLSTLQDAGVVAPPGGQYPSQISEFDGVHYVGPDDEYLGWNPATEDHPVGGYADDPAVLISNHDLVAQNNPDNTDVLDAIRDEIFK